jgi:hypothetical protein
MLKKRQTTIIGMAILVVVIAVVCVWLFINYYQTNQNQSLSEVDTLRLTLPIEVIDEGDGEVIELDGEAATVSEEAPIVPMEEAPVGEQYTIEVSGREVFMESDENFVTVSDVTIVSEDGEMTTQTSIEGVVWGVDYENMYVLVQVASQAKVWRVDARGASINIGGTNVPVTALKENDKVQVVGRTTSDPDTEVMTADAITITGMIMFRPATAGTFNVTE